MKFLIGYYNKSVIMTYFGVAAAVAGMTLAANGKIKYALLCMIICGICDLFDGAVARRCKRNDEEKAFGVQIDSLADMINFAAFPVVLGLALGCNAVWCFVIYALYVLAAIIRLGYFNVTTEENKGFYIGLPTTFAALIFTAVYLIGAYFDLELLQILYPVAMLLTSVLFVLNIKVPKPRKVGYILLCLIAIAMTVLVIFAGV